MKLRVALAALLAAVPLAAGPQSAVAQSSSFAGKTVTIVVGYKPGGGYDATARLLARRLPDHLPGKPTTNSWKRMRARLCEPPWGKPS